jgi:predicted acyltransferase
LPERLLSLDLFRGVIIGGMILVNAQTDPEAAYWPLKHAEWNGWTPADLIFPSFLFIVGVSLVFSFESRLGRGQSRHQIMGFALRRSVVLFVLGLVLNAVPGHFHLETLRIPGVLQRIAICYLVASFLTLWSDWRARIATVVVCLAGYWALMCFVPIPGHGLPGQDIPLLHPDHNLASWLDRKLLWGHLFEPTRDPEGLLSTVPAIATALLGVLTGEWLRTSRDARAKAAWMAVIGVCALMAGQILHIWFPINKKLWTSSFVIFTAGFSLVFLAVCYWALEIRKWRGRWKEPLLVFGMNPIAAYVFAGAAGTAAAWALGLTDRAESVLSDLLSLNGDPAMMSLICSLIFVLVCWAAMWVLYRKRIFLKI